MREISPAVNASVEEYLEFFPIAKPLVAEIRRQKQMGVRPRPSAMLRGRSSIFTRSERGIILDAIAALVDQNLTGRSDMCLQFAALLSRGLAYLNMPARAVIGEATYFSPNGRKIWSWNHAWVRVGPEVIDGNVDCLGENPEVPDCVRIAPYWGPIKETPPDRSFREGREQLPADLDDVETWWLELKSWLETQFPDTRKVAELN